MYTCISKVCVCVLAYYQNFYFILHNITDIVAYIAQGLSAELLLQFTR